MSWMYGKLVTISKFRVEGQAVDGTARPGADMEFMVTFDPVGAGCDLSNGFCNPGADITWIYNGKQVDEKPWVGYDDSLGGYVATCRVIAPQNGVMTMTARSQNDVNWTMNVSGTDTGAGTTRITEIQCYDPATNLAATCACGQGGTNEITMWFTAVPGSVGNGTAYYEVLVNGVVNTDVSPGVVNTNQGEADYSVSVPCPSVGSTIPIRGISGDSGASTVVGAAASGGGGNGGGGGGGGTGTTCDNPCTENYCDSTGNVWICSNGCAYQNGNTCQTGDGGGNGGGGGTTTTTTDIMTQIKTFYNENPTLCIAGGAVLLGVLLLGGSRRNNQG